MPDDEGPPPDPRLGTGKPPKGGNWGEPYLNCTECGQWAYRWRLAEICAKCKHPFPDEEIARNLAYAEARSRHENSAEDREQHEEDEPKGMKRKSAKTVEVPWSKENAERAPKKPRDIGSADDTEADQKTAGHSAKLRLVPGPSEKAVPQRDKQRVPAQGGAGGSQRSRVEKPATESAGQAAEPIQEEQFQSPEDEVDAIQKIATVTAAFVKFYVSLPREGQKLLTQQVLATVHPDDLVASKATPWTRMAQAVRDRDSLDKQIERLVSQKEQLAIQRGHLDDQVVELVAQQEAVASRAKQVEKRTAELQEHRDAAEERVAQLQRGVLQAAKAFSQPTTKEEKVDTAAAKQYEPPGETGSTEDKPSTAAEPSIPMAVVKEETESSTTVTGEKEIDWGGPCPPSN
eukprot:gnl/TRDRNA2_/TRDRNA2_178028_c3_seq2.p1 gnl/TRDRNA2_/TRDRNA2_178028_c3~~gnl/TRDRNA2_/TRDRNA2_178028_c3_seq2.p1  ORF type:complete len:403 (+),score=86.45 gnl/TRDRNA2_/TRDRNA2_178028_c3_seq2:110-1318(+)